MHKPKYIRIISWCIILTVFVWYNVAESQPARSSALDVGRDNPFAEIPRKEKPVLQEEPLELLVETVTLKSLEAANLKRVLDKMSSQYGSISTDAKSNSLIICDTKEYLEKILAQIQRADKAEMPQKVEPEVEEHKATPDS